MPSARVFGMGRGFPLTRRMLAWGAALGVFAGPVWVHAQAPLEGLRALEVITRSGSSTNATCSVSDHAAQSLRTLMGSPVINQPDHAVFEFHGELTPPQPMRLHAGGTSAYYGWSGPLLPSTPGRGRASDGKWLADATLPYRGGWIDPVPALGGLTQQTRIIGTRFDTSKCGAMVAVAASILGGEASFANLIRRIKLRASSKDELRVEQVELHMAARMLSVRDMHVMAEVLYKTFVGSGSGGATDAQIASMLRAAAYEGTPAKGKTPTEILAEMNPGELVPLSVYQEYPGETGWHVVLLWKDANGIARIYDSDKFGGSQVIHERLRVFREGYLQHTAFQSGHESEVPPVRFRLSERIGGE